MEREERDELYVRAIKKWGYMPQVNMVYEETGEVNTALARYLRGRADANDVLTEVAVVWIMKEQMAMLFAKEQFEKKKERKLQRLRERLDEADAKKEQEDGND